jgi:quinol monooxygenase YgiN
MIIVSGWLRVDAGQRDEYLASCGSVIEAARRAEGCHDFYLAADPIEPERINVFERWESVEAVEAFRGSGPDAGQQSMVVDAHVEQHDIASTISLT